jgi:hypothetical protein
MPLEKKQFNEQLVTDFHAQFPSLVSLGFEEISKLLSTKTVKPWYEQWSDAMSHKQLVPDQMAAAGVTPDMWSWYTSQLEQRKAARKLHAEVTQRLAREHEVRVRTADDTLNRELVATSSPFIKIIEAGYEELPLTQQAKLLQIEDTKARKVELARMLDAFRAASITAMYPDGTSFKPGSGPAEPGSA